MDNFTQNIQRVKKWQSITNLSCYSIKQLAKKIINMKALVFMMLFVFSSSMLFATEPISGCLSDAPEGPTEEMYALSVDCDGSVEVVKTTEVLGDNCSWEVIHSYQVKCDGQDLPIGKIYFFGGDDSAPTLDGELPPNKIDLNLCFDTILAGPTEAEIAALYDDNCSDVFVTKSGTPTGSDCSWTVKYLYTIRDACFNYATEVEIVYSGGDTSPPTLRKNQVIPPSEEGLNLCYDDIPQGPTVAEIAALFEDNCGNVTVTKSGTSKGYDCKWYSIYTYTIKDDCQNFADEVVISYSGSDTEAPEIIGAPANITVSCKDQIERPSKLTAVDNCTTDLEVIFSEDLNNLGNYCEGGTVVYTWTTTDDCGLSDTKTQTITVLPAPPAQWEEAPANKEIACSEADGYQPEMLYYTNGIEGECLISGEAVGVLVGTFNECGGDFTVTWSFEDDCGRLLSHVQYIVVLSAPIAQFVNPPQDMEISCEDANTYVADALEFSNNGTGPCLIEGSVPGELSGSHTKCGGTLYVDWNFIDTCGREITKQIVITVLPAPIAIFDDIPNVEILCEEFTTYVPEYLSYSNGLIGDCEISGSVLGIAESYEGGCGQFEVNYEFMDACGRTITKTQTISITDNTPPVIDCPEYDIYVGAELTTCEAIVNFEVNAIDNCSDVIISYSHNPGTVFPSGTTIVTVTAEDGCGNSDTCNFNVIVVDNCTPTDCCDTGDKPAGISFTYTGDDCSATTTAQPNDKYSCDTYSVLPDTVYIVASEDEDGGGLVWFVGTVSSGDTYTILASNGGESKFDSNTVITIYDSEGGSILQRTNFHTSCSAPLGVDDQYGANKIEGISFENGTVCGDTDTPPPSVDCCDTGDKPAGISFTYTGEDCSSTTTSQPNDKYSCDTYSVLPDTVYIVASEDEDGGGLVWFAGTVSSGDTYTILASNGGESKFDSNTVITIYDSEGGSILQRTNFHTSCSAPLGVDDQYGANKIEGISFENGAVCGDTDTPPPSVDCCDTGDKPAGISFTYTGQDCSATATSQPNDKYSCDTYSVLPDTVYIVASEDEDGGGLVWFAGTVSSGDTYTILASNGGESKFDSNTVVTIYDSEGGSILQRTNFHTSCSAPLGVDDQYGANKIEGISFENGAVCGVTDTPPSAPDCCDIGSKPSVLGITYTGEDCSATFTSQSADKYNCNGDPANTETVYIVASENDDGGGVVWFTGTVNLNETFNIFSESAGESNFKSNTVITLYNSQGGSIIQAVNFHTSCSQPIGSGNQFGSIRIDGIMFDDGAVCGQLCIVPPPPPKIDCCDTGDKPAGISFIYTGEDCSATATSQPSDKYSCDTYSALPDTVYIVASEDEDGGGLVWFAGTVSSGDTYTILASNGGESKFDSNTVVTIYDSEGGSILQRTNFHTSCSAPLGVDDQYGANKIEGISFENGAVCGDTDTPPPSVDCCDTGDKPAGISFTYTGEDCSATATAQPNDKYSCDTYSALPDTVYIVASEDEDGDGLVWFAGTVSSGDTYTILASNGGESKFDSNTVITIYDSEGGSILQRTNFHTSCSAPLGVDDQYGANKIEGISFENGAVCGDTDTPPPSVDCCDTGDKPAEISFTYTGQDCSATATTQPNDKYSCDTYSVLPDTVYIVASEDEDGGGLVWFAGTVSSGDTYTILASNGGETRFDSNTVVTIYDSEGGSILQRTNFHTSCSAPLGAGDQYGANRITRILFEDGFECVESTIPTRMAAGIDALDETITVDMTIYPNPFKVSATIDFMLPNQDVVNVEVYNILGQRVQSIYNGLVENGKRYQIELDPKGMSAGVYFIRLSTASGMVKIKRLIYSN